MVISDRTVCALNLACWNEILIDVKNPTMLFKFQFGFQINFQVAISSMTFIF